MVFDKKYCKCQVLNLFAAKWYIFLKKKTQRLQVRTQQPTPDFDEQTSPYKYAQKNCFKVQKSFRKTLFSSSQIWQNLERNS